jgi:hypothetical protein
MRISTRTTLLLATVLVAWPASVQASPLGPVPVCTCAAPRPSPASWTGRDRHAQVDTPPARPGAVRGEPDPCTPAPGRPAPASETPPGGGRPADPCTGRPAPGSGQPPAETGVMLPTRPPADVTSPALPARGDEAAPPVRATAPDPARAEHNRGLLRLQTLALRDAIRPGPAGSISVPTGFGVEWGEIFVGAAYQERTRYTNDPDAGLVIGTGIGSRHLLALEVAATSYSTVRDGGPGETGGLSFKLHRSLPNDAGIAAGYENALTWGGSDADPTLYVAASKVTRRTRRPNAWLDAVVLTLGVGNGRFRTEDADLDSIQTLNVFGALGVRVTEHVSLAADWTGQDVNAGFSITPIRRVPLVITPAVADILGTAGDGARFILSVGYGVGFRSLF